MGVSIVVLVAVVGIIVLVLAARAGRPRSGGNMSEADRYQQELARRAQAYTQQQAQAAAARRPVAPNGSAHPAGRTGYSGANAYRSTPAAGQNETHGQNVATGQNSGQFAGQQQQGDGLDPRLIKHLQQLKAQGQRGQAIAVLRRYSGLPQSDATRVIDSI